MTDAQRAVHAAPAAQGDPVRARRRATARRRSCASGSPKRKLPEQVATVAMREVDRLERMTPASPEYQMIRTYLDWVLDVPWAKTHRGSPRSDRGAARARRGPLRPRQGQGAHRRIPRGAEAASRDQGGGSTVNSRPDPLLRRPSRRRQDVARPVDRARDEPQVRAHLARRRARRGGDPRPPAHLHRLDARPPGAGAEDRGVVQPGADARRDRQDLGRHPGGPGGGAARGARSRRRTTRSAITTSRSRSISRGCCSSPPPTSSAPSIRRCSIGWS